MLSKLRSKFILINMLLVGVIITAVFLFVLMNSVVSRWNDLDDSLDTALEKPIDIPDVFPYIGTFGRSDKDRGDSSTRNVYVVGVTSMEDGSYLVVKSVNNTVSMSDDVLSDAIESVLNAGTATGWLENMDLIYKTVTNYGTVYIAFADTSEFVGQVKALLINSVSVCIIVLVSFFFISNFLASLALKPVEKAWEQQQHFLADASHELKTPLTVILANNNILLSHGDATVAEQMKWVQSTETEAEHMKRLVDELLFLAKSDAAKNELPKERVNISELAWSNMLQFEPVAFEKGVGFSATIEDELSVTGDRTQLNQLIHIFLDNAIKYAGIGGAVDWRLYKSTVGKTKPQSFAVLEVHNTGAPIPPDDIPHIFERFYRSDKARSADSGYGLGLAIAKTICDFHDASVTVDSREESGTLFTIRFRI